MRLCFAKDRLYLVVANREAPSEAPVQGCQILVLTLQGDILQVVTHPTEPMAEFNSICCFDDKLLASYYIYDTRSHEYGVLALQGL